MSERRQDGAYVTRGELRAVEARWRDRFAQLSEAREFYDAMCELGLRELLPVILRSERMKVTARALAEGRYRWTVRLTAYLLPVSIAVGAVGGAIAILRTLGIVH